MDQNKANVDIPDGIIDMKQIKEAAQYATYFVLEHEEYDKPVWDALVNDFSALDRIE
jgi:hypothetical protein